MTPAPNRLALTAVRFVAVIALAVSACAAQLNAGERLSVTLSSGRTFVGVVDTRTSSDRLWLRMGSGGVELLRPIDWRAIADVQLDGRRVDPQEFPALAASLESSGDRTFTSADEPHTATQAAGITDAARAQSALGLQSRVRTLDADAYLANWDNDVEADGLVVHVRPLDDQGRVVEMDGAVSISLFAPQRRDLDHAPHSRGSSIHRIGRWTRQLNGGQIGESGAVLKLPFQSVHPEFDVDHGPAGIVNLRLAAPGHGVFEVSIDDVRIRRYSGVRDLLELHYGKRFLPYEKTGPGAP